MSDYDADYWKDRPMEQKYYFMANQYIDFFKPKSVFDYGAGMGYLLHAFKEMDFNISIGGYDVSVYAANNAYGFSKGYIHCRMDSFQAIELDYPGKEDLVCCMDVLEHCDEAEARRVIERCVKLSKKHLLLSICMLGDSNYERDKTHVLCRTRSWWKALIESFGVREIDLPADTMYRGQLLAFEKVV